MARLALTRLLHELVRFRADRWTAWRDLRGPRDSRRLLRHRPEAVRERLLELWGRRDAR